MTRKVSPVISCRLPSPAWFMSVCSAPGPVTYTVSPSGSFLPSLVQSASSCLTMFRAASVDSLDSVSPMFPARFT
ncbi:Uncharacterised protein [Mycobacteroides abscessus subsp. abscessus]|nr:Uncharacterised protein [Mycobacteroides abscessus subsp. abscessus]